MESVILLMVDQYMFPPKWENEQLKAFRRQYTPTLEWITQNSIRYNNHYINTGACMPSRASILTGTMPKEHNVWYTDGVAKKIVNHLDPTVTPTIGNILKNNNILNPENIVYIGKQHIVSEHIIEDGKRLETIDKAGNIIPSNMEQYRNKDFLKDYGFKLLNGPDPHGPNETNAGYLVDPVYVDMAIDWISKNKDPYFMVLSLVEPHDIVYHPNLWNMWNLPKSNIDFDIISPTDDEPIIDEQVYKNWTKDYHKYFAGQDKQEYRKFYYYLLTILDKQLCKFFDFIKTKDVTVIFTSDHGDLLGTHNNGYQKWYALFEEITHVPLNILSFKKGESLYNQDVNMLSCHIDIVPTILDIYNVDSPLKGKKLLQFDNIKRTIKCDLRDHITDGPNNIRFVGRFFPDLQQEFDLTFIPTATIDENYAVKAKWVDTEEGIFKTIQYYNPVRKTKGLKLMYNITKDPCETISLV